MTKSTQRKTAKGKEKTTARRRTTVDLGTLAFEVEAYQAVVAERDGRTPGFGACLRHLLGRGIRAWKAEGAL